MNQKILVQKFGGTSVGSPDRIRAVADICIETKEKENCGLVVIVSAMGDTTDDLISLMDQITDDPFDREVDMLLSTGEQISVALLTMALHKKGQKAISFTGWQAGIKTESIHSKARIKDIDTSRILEALKENKIVIITGFQGISEEKEITTLGRGGSDTSAVAIAAALKAERCDIYTDVDAVHTADPRIVKNTGKLKYITYNEMLELAARGAKVLHPRSVETAKSFNLPLRVRSSWEKNNVGTLIIKDTQMLEGKHGVTGVAIDLEQARLSIIGVADTPGISYKIFSKLAEKNISVDLIIQSISSHNLAEVDFTVKKSDLKKAKQILEETAKELNAKSITSDDSIAKISIVGAGMIDEAGIAAKMFETLGKNNINIQMISTGEIHISCIINESDAEKAINLIHDAFELHKLK